VYFNRVIANFYGGGVGSNLFKSYKIKGRIIKDKFGVFYYLGYLFLRGIYILVVYLFNFWGLLPFFLKLRSMMFDNSSKKRAES
jgi:hypothetical protein